MFEGLRGIFGGPSYDQSADEARLEADRASARQKVEAAESAKVTAMNSAMGKDNATEMVADAQETVRQVRRDAAQEVASSQPNQSSAAASSSEGQLPETIDAVRREIENTSDNMTITPGSEAPASVAQSLNNGASTVNRVETAASPEVQDDSH